MKLNIIDYITKQTKLRQVDLASKLGVSRAQISKWKVGEYIPSARTEELMKIAGLFGNHAEWAIFAGTEENSQNWFAYFRYINNEILENNYTAYKFEDMPESNVPSILFAFDKLGVDIPSQAPAIKLKDEAEEDTFGDMVVDYLINYEVLIEWCSRYGVFELDGLDDFGQEMDSYSKEIALLSVWEDLLKKNGTDNAKIQEYKRNVYNGARAMIERNCKMMQEEGVSFRTNYFDILFKNVGVLQDELEVLNWSEDTTVECYLPYKDRVLLAEARKTNDLLEKLMKKVNAIMEG